MRTGTQPPRGTRGGFKRDQLPATAGPSLRLGVGEDRGSPRPGEPVPPAPWSRDGLRPPGGARRPAGSELSPAGLHGSLPGSSSGGSRQSWPSPDGRGPAAARPLFPTLPGVQLARSLARAPGRRPAGTVPSPYSRRLSGGCHSAVTCPSPRQGSADQLITGGQARAPGRAGQATPPSVACSRRAPPRCRPRPFAGGGVARLQNSDPCRLSRGEGGWCPVQPTG